MREEVYIRPLTVYDAAVSWKWRNDSGLWRFTESHPDVYVTEEMERAWATRVVADKTRINFAICLRPSNRYIGNIYLVNVKDGVGELGIFIGERDCHGKGYGQTAISLLKRIVASEYGIKTIRIGVNKDNTAALISYLKAGGKIEDAQQWIHLVLDLTSDDVENYLSSVSSDFNPAAETSLGIKGYSDKLAGKGRTIAAIENAPDGGGDNGNHCRVFQ